MIRRRHLLVSSAFAAALPLARAGSYDDFFKAVKRDDAKEINDLLRRGFDANTIDPSGRPGLFIAVQEGSLHAAEALIAWRRTAPDLIVLDIGMPERDGLDVCRQIRKSSEVPILFLSARDEEVDRVIGLEIGGDDYVSKPFSPRELVARVKAILKRAGGAANSAELTARGALRLDRAGHSVHWGEEPIALTALEFAVLAALLGRADMVFTREQLMVAAYGGGELTALSPGPYILSYGTVAPDQTIDVLIRWDHRVTDGAPIAKALTRLEQVLNTEIAAELRSLQRPA